MNLREEIAEVAYELFKARGCVIGCDLDDWLNAERIILARHAAQEIEEPEDVDISEELAFIHDEELEIVTSRRN